jgi:hypothetical protein
MKLHKRLEKLERHWKTKAVPVATRDLTGVEWEKVLAEVDSALAPADMDLVDQIMSFTRERAQVTWHNESTGERYLTDDGQEQPTPHFFIRWLWGLTEGCWRLPEPLPREVLEGFCCLRGTIVRRCEDCLSALGNGRSYEQCPVCQSERLSVSNMSGGDPAWRPGKQRGPADKRSSRR